MQLGSTVAKIKVGQIERGHVVYMFNILSIFGVSYSLNIIICYITCVKTITCIILECKNQALFNFYVKSDTVHHSENKKINKEDIRLLFQ